MPLDEDFILIVLFIMTYLVYKGDLNLVHSTVYFNCIDYWYLGIKQEQIPQKLTAVLHQELEVS